MKKQPEAKDHPDAWDSFCNHTNPAGYRNENELRERWLWFLQGWKAANALRT